MEFRAPTKLWWSQHAIHYSNTSSPPICSGKVDTVFYSRRLADLCCHVSDSTFMFKSRSPGYATWGDMASKLEDEAFRAEYVASTPFFLHYVNDRNYRGVRQALSCSMMVTEEPLRSGFTVPFHLPYRSVPNRLLLMHLALLLMTGSPLT
jgi:hypothetical protein